MKKESGIRALIEFDGSESEFEKITSKLTKLGIRVQTTNITPLPTEGKTLFAIGTWPTPESPASLFAINTVPIPDKPVPWSLVAIETVPLPEKFASILLTPIFELLMNMQQLGLR